MIETINKGKAQPLRRHMKRERAFCTKAFSLPVDIAVLVEQEADLNYGGNQSALATAAFCEKLGVKPKVEYVLE